MKSKIVWLKHESRNKIYIIHLVRTENFPKN